MEKSSFKSERLTEFEKAVLAATLSIPFGETRTYAWVARRIGKPKAVRAVGSALRKNPWPLIIPCHRVVRSDGAVGQYAGGEPLSRLCSRCLFRDSGQDKAGALRSRKSRKDGRGKTLEKDDLRKKRLIELERGLRSYIMDKREGSS